MPVDSTHPEYDDFIDLHLKCRCAYEGEQAVKDKGTTYLPALSGMDGKDDDRYKAYLSRAMFYGATRRTVDGLAGVVDRKPPQIDVKDGLPWEDNIDGNGITLAGFANQIVTEEVLIGWQGILVDRKKEYEYPYPVQYHSEQIINWAYEGDKLVMVMLEEVVNERAEDGYEVDQIKQWRELTLENGHYEVYIWRKSEEIRNGQEFVLHEKNTPTKRGQLMEEIPFVFVSMNNCLENPPLMDMVEVNYHHYQNSADYEHGLHFTGLPTPYIFGISQQLDEKGDNIPIMLGSETCIVGTEAGARAGFMEVTSEFNGLVTAMDNKKLEMATLGARLLQNEKKAAEAAETARINKSGDSNVLAKIVMSVERSLNQVLSIMSVWEGQAEDANTIELNHDFVDEGLSSHDLTALVSAWQAGAISQETLLYNLHKKDVLPDGVSIEDEMAKVEAEAPKLNSIPTPEEDEEEEDDKPPDQ